MKCIFCTTNGHEDGHDTTATKVMPQSSDGGITVKMVLCCAGHAAGWWDGADWDGRHLEVPITADNCLPYFASEVQGDSSDIPEAIALGILKKGQTFYQLQKNDELGLFETDDAAITAAISDAEQGDLFAIEQLALAGTDPLVFKLRQQMSAQHQS